MKTLVLRKNEALRCPQSLFLFYRCNYTQLKIFDEAVIIFNVTALPSCKWKGGEIHVKGFISFLLSIMADVISYFVCKWLDRDE